MRTGSENEVSYGSEDINEMNKYFFCYGLLHSLLLSKPAEFELCF